MWKTCGKVLKGVGVEELEQCFEIRKEIESIEERIIEMKTRIYSPKNQVITGMPNSISGGGGIEKGICIIEKLAEDKNRLQKELDDIWVNVKCKVNSGIIDDFEYEILFLRFYSGLKWKDVADALNYTLTRIHAKYSHMKSRI